MTPRAGAMCVLVMAAGLVAGALAGCGTSQPSTPAPAAAQSGGRGGGNAGDGGSGGNGNSGGAGSGGSGGGAETPAGSGGAAAGPPDAGQASGGSSPPGDAASGDSGPAAPPPAEAEQPLPACLKTTPVAESGALAAAITAAQAGDCLVLADGNYSFPVITKTATEAAPIVIRAEHRLKATVTSGSIALVDAAYVTLEGLTFSSSGNIKLTDSHHCRISRLRIQPVDTTDVDWVEVAGTSHHVRIDHNDFGPKTKLSNMLMLSGKGAQVVQYNQIDHNYFHDIAYGGGNGWETIRAGLSHLAPSQAFTVIEYNLFRNTAGDPETISIKSSDNEIRYNTFRDVPGEMTLRHGNRNHVYGNYILGGNNGIRVCGSEHLIYNNYIAGVKSGRGIWLEGGDGDGIDVPGKQHYRVYRTQVVNNTVVGGTIDVGGGHPLQPVDCTVANNLARGIGTGGTGTRYLGNLTAPVPPGAPAAGTAPGQIEKLALGHPAIDASLGQFDFVKDDIEGQPRDKSDVGADELSEAPVLRHSLTEADVGPEAP